LIDPAQPTEIIIYAENNMPLQELRIPIEFSGTLDLDPYSMTWSTAGCRTEYFNLQQIHNINPAMKQVSFRLAITDGSPCLPAGNGPVLKVFLETTGHRFTGRKPKSRLTGYGSFLPRLTGDRGEYIAGSHSGLLYYGDCCVGVRGNVDGDPLDQITISDLVYLVTYMFQSVRCRRV